MPISKPHSTLGADNKGSCSNLAIYLEKENEELDKIIKKSSSLNEITQLENRKQGFFTASKVNISTIDVISAIDNNKRKLGANDAKYFAPTISFSENELSHIAFLATGKREVTSVLGLNLSELEQFNNLITEYGRKVMDNYALNFNRQDKGIKAGSDLVYFAKIEHFRKYKGTDKEVLNGNEISGEYKKGLQSHIHIIVSRKDKTQILKLSPTCNEKQTNRKIGNNEYQVGFDRVKWINSNEKTFDEHFNYKRKELEKFQNQNILKNGNPQDKHEINKKIEIESINRDDIKKQIKNAHFNVLMTKPNNLKEYQQRMMKFAIQVLPTINKNGFIQENHFFHEQSGINFKGSEVDQNLKLHELFSDDSKTTRQVQQTEPSLEDWKINTGRLTSILSSLLFETAPDVDYEFPKRRRKKALRR
ncbi:DUF5712 family protein [Flavobacterium sp. LHD-85]|uniref:DUF5712 family protein n=1 Tax=Flavobacterium sp. LHD-85 TaxID=3071410 RepID=UPI0027DF64D7|nr:DUF5712 family protein [Flavobacterium sp. LHD-85]MDQ6528923.1 DUF5712 family protein [Flavobacterium sp. LHD-85]